MNLILGILLVILTCAVILGIVLLANRNIRNYDEKNHENFLS
ncbi:MULTISPECIES: hypothetical protein [Paenibacillus]|nr:MULTISPECIES: hypothetical protein [Paenibacillus]